MKNNKPIIGIICRKSISVLNRDVWSVEETYTNAIVKAGGIPILITPSSYKKFPYESNEEVEALTVEEKEDIFSEIDLCDGILLPGGFRIFEFDKVICNYVLEKNIPVLGICMGMQILAICDVVNEKNIELINNGVNHKSEEIFLHKVNLNKNSFLYDIVKEESFSVNSKHKCKIIKTNNFDVAAVSEDGIIEAIERKDKKFAIGVQWHPELLYDISSSSKKLIDKFINVCKKNEAL